MKSRILKQEKKESKISIELSLNESRNLISFLDRVIELYADEFDGIIEEKESKSELKVATSLKKNTQTKIVSILKEQNKYLLLNF